MSANAVAITFCPRSWPSCPILATRMRGRRPSASANFSTSSVALTKYCSPFRLRRDRPRRWYGSPRHACPKPFPARRRSPPRWPWPAPRRWPARAGCLRRQRPGSARPARRRPRPGPGRRAAAASLAICSARTRLFSTLCTSISWSSSTWYLLMPITVCAPESMRAWVRAAASSMRSFGMPSSMACAMPPCSATSAMCARARCGELMGQPLHVIRTAPRVDRPGGAGLLLQQQLGVAGDAGREVGRQRQRLVEGVGVQRLGVPLGGGHRLDAGAGDVVERVLRGQRPPGGLRMGAQRLRFRVLGVELRRPVRSTAADRRAAWRPP